MGTMPRRTLGNLQYVVSLLHVTLEMWRLTCKIGDGQIHLVHFRRTTQPRLIAHRLISLGLAHSMSSCCFSLAHSLAVLQTLAISAP